MSGTLMAATAMVLTSVDVNAPIATLMAAKLALELAASVDAPMA